MIKNIAISIAAAAALAGIASCNSDSYEYHTELDGSAIVKSFSLVENDKVLADLDSVYFSIDLVNGEIFNADSLPMGTRIAAIAATITTDNPSAVTLYIPRPGQSDSVVDYLKNSADTIDFSNGPVRLEVTSQNGLTVKNYNIRINVHTVKSDSLCWGSEAIAPLPAPSGATAQRTVQRGSAAYTFSTDGSHYNVAATSDFAAWDPEAFTPGFAMDVASIVATDDKFYALATDGTLWSATQAAGPWSSEGLHFSCLYGAYGAEVVGLCTDANDGATPGVMLYPSLKPASAPAGMPVSGFSPAVCLSAADGENTSQLIIAGGRDSDGRLTAETFGFDGSSWVQLSLKGLPEAMEGLAVAPYYSLRNKAIEWRVDVLPTLLAMGGRKADGKLNDVVYMSRDWGMHWQKADSLLQPGTHMPVVCGAQTLVAEHTFGVARSAGAWQELPARRMPIGARFAGAATLSRATAPITEWDAPYIYLFGGYTADGKLNTGIWRGVINRFTFKPIQ